jgi:hypothetical protein
MAEDTAGVEGYRPAAENLALDDHALAQKWTGAMVDYRRDKGLIP